MSTTQMPDLSELIYGNALPQSPAEETSATKNPKRESAATSLNTSASAKRRRSNGHSNNDSHIKREADDESSNATSPDEENEYPIATEHDPELQYEEDDDNDDLDYDFDHVDQTMASSPSTTAQEQRILQTINRFYTSDNPLGNEAMTSSTPFTDDAQQPVKSASAPVSIGRRRCIEWDAIRTRWKRRKYDYRQEPDTGQAVQSLIEYSESRLKEQSQRIKEAAAESEGEIDDEQKDNDGNDDLDAVANSNASIEGEDDYDGTRGVLNELLKGSTQIKQDDGNNQDDVPPSYADTLSPWEYGQFPKRDSVNTTASTNTTIPLLQSIRGKLNTAESGTRSDLPPSRLKALLPREETSREDAVYTVRSFPSTVSATTGRSMYGAAANAAATSSFPLHHTRRTERPASSLLYPRFIFRAAARHLTGTAVGAVAVVGADTNALADQQRCIQALWKLSHQKVFDLPPNDVALPHRNTSTSIGNLSIDKVPDWSQAALLSETHCRRQGQALWTFYQTAWKNRKDAAEVLGVSRHADNDLLVGVAALPRQFVGTSMSTLTAAKRLDYQLQKTIQEHGLAKATMGADDMSSFRPGATLLDPQTRYSFVPGTVPPTPMLPLDVTAIVFGPTDRNEHVVELGRVDDAVYKLTLSSLIVRASNVLQQLEVVKQESTHQQQEERRLWRVYELTQQQIGAVLQQVVKLNQNKLYKRIQRQFTSGSELELPLAFFYRALSEYCSCMLNGVAFSVAVGSDDEDNPNFGTPRFTVNDVRDEAKEEPNGDLVRAVEHLFEFLEEHIDHNGLQRFTDLHVTWALLHIAKMLPAPAIELLSRPFDRHSCRTPFERMSQLLQYLEDSDCLVDTGDSYADKSIINVGELEFALHRASIIFARSVEREPTNVNCHAWHVATLASSLLLCSGNRVGSGALPSPSRMSTSHESHVRRMLPKFHELRHETAKSFHLLVHLAKYQQGIQASLAVASFLEWQQVVALMVGPGIAHRSTSDSICQLHAHYSKHWALLESSDDSLRDVEVREAMDDRLHSLAHALEMKPSDVGRWRALVAALGPLGGQSVTNEFGVCSDIQCKECSRLSNKGRVDHHRDRLEDDWGFDRADWWYDSLLQQQGTRLTKSDSMKVSREYAEGIVATFLEALDTTQSVSKTPTNATIGRPAFDHATQTHWLDNLLQNQHTVHEDRSLNDDMDEPMDDVLPSTFLERCNEVNPTEESLDRLVLTGKDALHWELWAYKVAILCHLNSTLHAGIDIGVDRLIGDAWDAATGRMVTDSDSFRCLSWLYYMGLDVAQVFLQSQQHGV